MSHLTVLPICRSCGRALPLDPADAWLVCDVCGRADSITVDNDREGVTLDVRFLTARGYDRQLAVPFFRFPRPEQVAAAIGLNQATQERLSALGSIWVIATPLRRFHGYGDVSYELTRRPPRLEPGESPNHLVGAGRTLTDAERIARILVWRYLGDDRRSPEVELEITLGRPELCAVAVQIDDGLLKFPHCPIRYPVAVIERLPPALTATSTTEPEP